MFLQNKFFTKILTILALATISISACASTQAAQPTRLPNPTATTTIATMVPITETPDFSSGATKDAKLVSDRMNAIKATTTLASSLPNASQEEITKTLLQKWLEYYKTDQVDEYLRLKDYEIEEITPNGGCPHPDKDTTISLASILISVQTVNPHSGDWQANANAIDGDDNWLYHLSATASITASKGFYTLGFEGVPPCYRP